MLSDVVIHNDPCLQIDPELDRGALTSVSEEDTAEVDTKETKSSETEETAETETRETSEDHSKPYRGIIINHYSAKLNNLNFQPLEFVSRYRDPQLQLAENY